MINSRDAFNSWGNYPVFFKQVHQFESADVLKGILAEHEELICYGNGRSYGDSALNQQLVYVKPYHYFLNFEQSLDQQSAVLHCQAGVLLSEIIDSFVPRGYFLQITPGTKYITVGGAIASDVHGKNHHIAGAFSECVEEFNLMLADGQVVTCSASENVELFRASCGGMGLTGVILDAKIRLKAISSAQIEQVTVKTHNLQETLDAFAEYDQVSYSVAWIDCLAQGEAIGRSLLMLGEHAEQDDAGFANASQQLTIPFNFPSFALNHWSVKAFNTLYYARIRQHQLKQTVSLNSFFYPLDSIEHWNRMYGKNGFTQYQFVLPLESSYEGLRRILTHIAVSGKGSFLSVLKRLGKENQNWLSFPMEGYTLALDFKLEPTLFQLLDELDKMVVEFGGRIYLAKDVRVSQSVFESGYPHIEKFRSLREQNQMNRKFNSLQSLRIGI